MGREVGGFSPELTVVIAPHMWDRMTIRPTRARTHSMAVRLDRALTLLDRIISLVEQGEPRDADPGTWSNMKSRVKGWNDPEVRNAIIAVYGRSSTREASNLLVAEFGTRRAPTKSALSRLFIQMARHEIGAAD